MDFGPDEVTEVERLLHTIAVNNKTFHDFFSDDNNNDNPRPPMGNPGSATETGSHTDHWCL